MPDHVRAHLLLPAGVSMRVLPMVILCVLLPACVWSRGGVEPPAIEWAPLRYGTHLVRLGFMSDPDLVEFLASLQGLDKFKIPLAVPANRDG